MPFASRDALGRIESLHRHPEPGATEELDPHHPEVLEFVGTAAAGTEEFQRLDAGFVRVIEDLIDVLIIRNLISITDLPIDAQNKLFARKSFRESAARQPLRLFGDSPSPDVLDATDFSALR